MTAPVKIPLNDRGHLSSETIDLLLLSALGADEANTAKRHIDDCEHCRTRWRELNEDKQRFEQFVFARTLPKVEARVLAERSSFFERFRLKILLPALAVAGAAAVVAVSGPGSQTEDDSYVGIKGSNPSFEVFAARGQGDSFHVKSETVLQPSDRIRFVVNPAGARYLMVVSMDGAGVFSVYHPYGARQSTPINTLSKFDVPGAVELDDTMGEEHVWAVFSQDPVSADAVQEALKANPAEPKLPGVSFVSRGFRKAQP